MDNERKEQYQPSREDMEVIEQLIRHIEREHNETKEYAKLQRPIRRRLFVEELAVYGPDRFRLRYGINPPKNRDEELILAFENGEISIEEYKKLMQEHVTRPIDLKMLDDCYNAYMKVLRIYAEIRQLILEIVTDQRNPDSWATKEPEVTRLANRLTEKLGIYSEELKTVQEFQTMQRMKLGANTCKVGNWESATATSVVNKVVLSTSEQWLTCLKIAENSRTDPAYLYATNASQLFFDNMIKETPLPDQLTTALYQDYILTKDAINKAVASHKPKTNEASVIQANIVQISTPETRITSKSATVDTPKGKRNPTCKPKKRDGTAITIALKKLLRLSKQDRLPKSMQDAAKLTKIPYSTLRKAVLHSPVLRKHFPGIRINTSSSEKDRDRLLKDLLAQVPNQTKNWLRQLSQKDSEQMLDSLLSTPSENMLEIVSVLASNPDAGSTGDCSYSDCPNALREDKGY